MSTNPLLIPQNHEYPAYSIARLIQAQQQNDGPALYFEDQRYSYREYVTACCQFANLLLEQRQPGPFHVGVLLDNVPAYTIALGGAALVGAALVGLNPTRRGAQLERDIAHSDCQFLISENKYSEDLQAMNINVVAENRFNIDGEHWQASLEKHKDKPVPFQIIDTAAPYLLIFTSGTTGNPKAALCSQQRLAGIADAFSEMNNISSDEVSYLAMPLFHSNALMANWSPMVSRGVPIVLRRKFSASGFLPDIRRHQCTFMNYVGKPLTYILATPEKSDDSDNALRLAFGNEAVVHDIKKFEKRFGCVVIDNYGSTEGGISIIRTDDTPDEALGFGQPGTVILDPETGKERAVATFDENGKIKNADDAVGEIANIQSAQRFEGYWRNDEANTERTQGGIFWSGDLGYRDANGFLYFGGRNYDWLRVDGENFAAAPVETILTRHLSISIASVYAVPNSDVGDDVMVALLLSPNTQFDSLKLSNFIDEQSDMGTKWLPRYVRVSEKMPTTASNKILKRDLRAEGWECSDPVWERNSDNEYVPLTKDGKAAIRQRFADRDRLGALDFLV